MLLAAMAAAAQTVTVKSPDGNVEIAFATLKNRAPAESGQLSYKVTFFGKAVMDWSRLGLDIQGAPPLGADVRITASPTTSADGTWTAIHGKSKQIRDQYNAVTVQTTESGRMRRALNVEARAYNDGVAFRYFLPGGGAPSEVRIAGELTQFHYGKEGTAYPLVLRGYRSSYEDDYLEVPLSGMHPEYLTALPFLVDLPGVAWVAVTEAYLDNYAGLYVSAAREPRTMEAKLAPRIDEPGLAVSTQTPMRSPWRVLMIGTEPGRLVESNIVLNLNPPSAIADTSWIKPGKTSWDWWSGSVARNVNFESGMNTATMKHYIDFSSRNHLEYMLVDAGWAYQGTGPNDSGADLTRTNPAIDMPELLSYAKSKNVRLWLWAHWSDIDRQIDEAFPLFEKWGIAGVKIDFMDRDDQWMVNWYRRVAKKAAEHKLMLDYHGGGCLQARRPASHLSQPADARGRDGARIHEVERSDHAAPQHHAGVHTHVGRSHGLHAGRL